MLAQLFELAGVRMTGANYKLVEDVVDHIIAATLIEMRIPQ